MVQFFSEGLSIWRAILSYLSAMLLIIVSGCGYTFATYSQAMEARFHTSHTQIGLIYTVGCVGGVGAVGGFVADSCGLRWTILLGTILASGGWAAMAMCSAGLIPSPFSFLLFCYLLTMQGLIVLYMGAFVNIKNVHTERKGIGLGLLDMSYGLSSVIFSQIYQFGFDRGRPAADQDLTQFFVFQAVAVLCCGTAGIVTTYVPSHTSQSRDAVNTLSYKAGIRTIDFWLLWFIALFFSMTMGWYTGSLGNQLEALNCDLRPSMMNTLLMASGVICRTAVGIGSDYLHIERVTLLAIILVPATLAFLVLGVFGKTVFLPTLIFIGIGFGSSWCLVPLQIADSFGAGFASLWGLALVATAVGPILMEPIDSLVWSTHADKSGACSGLTCYQVTYVCASFLCGICVILSGIVGRRRSQSKASRDTLCTSSYVGSSFRESFQLAS